MQTGPFAVSSVWREMETEPGRGFIIQTPAIPTRPLACFFFFFFFIFFFSFSFFLITCFLLFSSLHLVIFHTLATRARFSYTDPEDRYAPRHALEDAALNNDSCRCFHHCLLLEGLFRVLSSFGYVFRDAQFLQKISIENGASFLWPVPVVTCPLSTARALVNRTCRCGGVGAWVGARPFLFLWPEPPCAKASFTQCLKLWRSNLAQGTVHCASVGNILPRFSQCCSAVQPQRRRYDPRICCGWLSSNLKGSPR
ncbi:hypothetical protein GE21DRAFT_1343722 [Neurospora crassa]|nr:hypothetical protein B14D6.350 [imported] - Neurospora crassa [Neurospora crassa]KHE87633.1 hypothetical protein GE21DRAFT_1343722 [Neurospora crassa]